ncbi:ComF family protein [Bifidobacterium sp. SMB2]|uniref:ComF family protein n=1 Tax=Bifidobacterium saimiriisciurei TaxID=2661627 RepID=A0ABX0C6K3_9BIFI|nr:MULTISPECIES: phosphoribosyltransferase family protein [Bifidobacterium]NEG96126.1 ComF family protein [Bifidobacterium sp. SMB2]NEH10796.1 ComF family protein [Bifidobacterium saimiriisciurei]
MDDNEPGTLLRLIRDIMLPRGCAGCDAPDERLCATCAAGFRRRVVRAVPATMCSSGRVLACGWYRGGVRRAILRWKDHGDEEITPDLASMMRERARNGAVEQLVDADRRVVVVPVPSSPKSLRRRGRSHVVPLARAVCAHLTSCGLDAVVMPALSITGVQAKSVQRSRPGQRAARLSGHIHVRNPETLRGGQILLVDDIVTTGATIRQCSQTLQDHDATVVAAMTLAAVAYCAT